MEAVTDEAEAKIVIENAYDADENLESHPYFLFDKLQMIDINSRYEKKATNKHPKSFCLVFQPKADNWEVWQVSRHLSHASIHTFETSAIL